VTSKNTLLSQEGTFFYHMVCNEFWQPDEDGEYFIDRNPLHFSRLLDFLRLGTFVLPKILLRKNINYYYLILIFIN